MILYNKTIAKEEMKKDKKYAKEDAKRIEKEIKQVKTGLEFLKEDNPRFNEDTFIKAMDVDLEKMKKELDN